MLRVLVKLSPSTCHPGESRELSQGILTQSLFTLSYQPAGQTFLLSCPGWDLWPGPPLSPIMTKCQVLISHLLQCRLGLAKDFFRSLILFLYSFFEDTLP